MVGQFSPPVLQFGTDFDGISASVGPMLLQNTRPSLGHLRSCCYKHGQLELHVVVDVYFSFPKLETQYVNLHVGEGTV